MSNISVNINLKLLKNAFVKKMNSPESGMLDVLIIPIKMNNLFVGEKGIYLDMQAVEIQNPKPGTKDTHIVKQALPKSIYNSLTDEEKKAMPIIGNAILWNKTGSSATAQQSTTQTGNNTGAVTNGGTTPDDDDLPF